MNVPVRVWENSGPVMLSEIVPWCLDFGSVDTLLLTSRPSTAGRKYSYDKRIDTTTRALLGTGLIETFETNSWPGTELVGHKGRIYVARFDFALARTMSALENDLFAWLHSGSKGLPEDICLFKRGGDFPMLISVTHEREAWMIADRCPPGFRASDLRPEHLLIGSGRYHCEK